MKIPLWRRIALRLTRWIWQPTLSKIEAAHFRTVHDTGADPRVSFVWSLLRRDLGLHPTVELATFCKTCRVYHLSARPCVPPTNSDHGLLLRRERRA